MASSTFVLESGYMLC